MAPMPRCWVLCHSIQIFVSPSCPVAKNSASVMKVRTAFRKLSDARVMPCVPLPLRMVLGSALHKSEFVLSANCRKRTENVCRDLMYISHNDSIALSIDFGSRISCGMTLVEANWLSNITQR